MASDTVELDQIWTLLDQGNTFYESNEYWKAADYFDQAQTKLMRLSDRINVLDKPDSVNEESLKIAKLYKEQAKEYFHKAQHSLIAALKQKLDCLANEDEEGRFLVPVFEPDDEGHEKFDLFCRLFTHKDLIHHAPRNSQSNKQGSSELSIEERLAQLNENLPSNLLTSEQRMLRINKGLNRLGFSLTDSNGGATDRIELPLSEDDQVAAIIAQAKEELSLQLPSGLAGEHLHSQLMSAPASLYTDEVNNKLPEDSSSANNESSSSEEEMELSADQLESIREKVAGAEAQLSMLLVLLQPDAGGYSEIEFEPAAGRNALVCAKKLLDDAVLEWKANENDAN